MVMVTHQHQMNHNANKVPFVLSLYSIALPLVRCRCLLTVCVGLMLFAIVPLPLVGENRGCNSMWSNISNVS
jgi:hypothetical protein